jgi:hypothetical protein
MFPITVFKVPDQVILQPKVVGIHGHRGELVKQVHIDRSFHFKDPGLWRASVILASDHSLT